MSATALPEAIETGGDSFYRKMENMTAAMAVRKNPNTANAPKFARSLSLTTRRRK